MSNPMRAPSPLYEFSIPYSGTLANGDCVLFVSPISVEVAASYMNGVWKHPSDISLLEDTEHIIHINRYDLTSGTKATFVPGPNH